jgi:hypothetical protein
VIDGIATRSRACVINRAADPMLLLGRMNLCQGASQPINPTIRALKERT